MKQGSIFATEALLVEGSVVTLDSNYYLLGNKVLDGKFDLWNTAAIPRFWTPTSAGGSAVIQSSAYPQAGTYSCRLTIDGNNANAQVAQTIHLFPGFYYTLTVYVRNSAAGKTAKIQLADTGGNTYLQSDGTWAASGFISVANSNQVFTATTITFKAANYETYTLSLANDSAASSNVYFDTLSIVEAATGRPTAQFPLPAREAEVFCYDAPIQYGIGGLVPTAGSGIYMEPTPTPTEGNPRILRDFGEIRTFRAIRDASVSALLMVNYKR